MNKNPLITVIVPVYNTSSYIRECLDSICAQTYSNIEILCVNDGSTDNSAEILEEYASKDSRVKVITQENAGLSAARNTALKQAKGEWVTGIDSDDYILPETLELCARHMSDSEIDLIRYNLEDFRDDEPDKVLDSPWLKPIANGKTKVTEDIILKQNVAFWGKIWRLSFIQAQNLTFPVGLLYEDQYFWFAAMPHIQYMYFETSDKASYRYRRRVSSIIGSSNARNNFRILEILKIVELNLEEFKRINVRARFGYSADTPSKLELSMIDSTYKNIMKWSPEVLFEQAWKKLREIINENGYAQAIKHYSYTWLLLQYHMSPDAVLALERHYVKRTEFNSMVANAASDFLLYEPLKKYYRHLAIKAFFSFGEKKKLYIEKRKKIEPKLRQIRTLLKSNLDKWL